ncbi:MAG: hypothetical protein ACRYGO_11365 [Janthinobacterium lividum]
MRFLLRFLLSIVCLATCLQGCGGDTSFALFVHWGGCDFDRERWAHADRSGHGCMLDSFFDKHAPEQMSVAELELLLGEPTGYAGDDGDPAYIVVPAGAGARAGGGQGREQLLVFRTDPSSGRIVEVQLRPLG